MEGGDGRHRAKSYGEMSREPLAGFFFLLALSRGSSEGGSLSPGMTDMVFRARRTLKVRSAETLPRSTNSVTYL